MLEITGRNQAGVYQAPSPLPNIRAAWMCLALRGPHFGSPLLIPGFPHREKLARLALREVLVLEAPR